MTRRQTFLSNQTLFSFGVLHLKIGGFEVGDYAVKESGGKRNLIFDCRDCVFSANIQDDWACRFHALFALRELEADLIVLSEVYERVYEEKQTKMLLEISSLHRRLENDGVWSYNRLGDPTFGEKQFGERHDALVNIAHDLLWVDPIQAYIRCLQEVKKTADLMKDRDDAGKKDLNVYFQTLDYVKSEMEKTSLISQTKQYLLRLSEVPETMQLYRVFFEAQLKPAFIGSRLMFEEMEQLELLDEYSVKKSSVQVFRHPNKPSKLYFINPPEYSLAPEKYFVLSKTREVVQGYKPGKTSLSAIAKSRKYFERVYESTIADVAKNNHIDMPREEMTDLAEIVARYTVGYGILEILLSDRKITDIYVDSPIGNKPIYIVHSDWGHCQTNVLYTEGEASALVSKLRAMSGRPFDESHPVLDFDLEDLETRVAAIGPPLAPDGIAFAFRLHKVTPWTLPQFIDKKMMTPLAAGLLSFFIDSQATMLVTGSRGSGKTSLLQALMLEIIQNTRIIVQEDTLEIPVPYLKGIGFNVQRLKTRSAISVSKTESEVAPDESLRTALRLGDSALILGEVRSLEAKVLYEAMRVGAAGNIVMGTIHGDSAYSVWDRVVNDLEVPNTSFKATDIVAVARPIRFAGSLERARRLVQVTEVKKHWISEPEREGGFLDLMLYDAKKDKIDWVEDSLKKSELFSKISSFSGLSVEQLWKSVKLNSAGKEHLVALKNQHQFPYLLEAENVVHAQNKLSLIKEEQIQQFGSPDYDVALEEWKIWTNDFLKRLMARKK